MVGIYSLWVKHGEVSLLGASLGASDALHHVFAPVTQAIPLITALSEVAELVMSTNEAGIRYMGDVSRHFAGIWEPTFMGTMLSFHVVSFLREPSLMCSANPAQQLHHHSKRGQDVSKELRRLTLEPWSNSIRAFLHRERITLPKVLVSGAKGSGKSTLCRCLMNAMLTMNVNRAIGLTKAFPNGIIFLDIDPGQPELAAPGIIYLAHVGVPLLGPSFTNLLIPDTKENVMLRMHYIAAYTPRESPSHYQNCVSDLLSLYRNHYESFPLIINSCGWDTGSGKAILSSALQGIDLTDYMHFGVIGNELENHFMQPHVEGEKKAIYPLPSQPNKTPLKSGRDCRKMQLQAYLHASGVVNGRVLWDPFPITMLRDIMSTDLSMSEEVSMIIMLDKAVVAAHIADALPGSVAAIVVIKHDSPLHGLVAANGETQDSLQDGMQIALSPDSQIPYLDYGDKVANPLDPKSTECLGLGVVTAVLAEERQLRIKSPVSASHIQIQLALGRRIALVLARQQGVWTTMESILAREQRPKRLQSKDREDIIAQERNYAENLHAGTNAQADPGWNAFFQELEKTGRPSCL